jgi:hypothetical protein
MIIGWPSVTDDTEYRIVNDVLLRPIGTWQGKPARVQCWAVNKDGNQCFNWAKWLTAGYVPVCHRHTKPQQPYVCQTCMGTGVCADGPDSPISTRSVHR